MLPKSLKVMPDTIICTLIAYVATKTPVLDITKKYVKMCLIFNGRCYMNESVFQYLYLFEGGGKICPFYLSTIISRCIKIFI